jgi:hypothetical protein
VLVLIIMTYRWCKKKKHPSATVKSPESEPLIEDEVMMPAGSMNLFKNTKMDMRSLKNTTIEV